MTKAKESSPKRKYMKKEETETETEHTDGEDFVVKSVKSKKNVRVIDSSEGEGESDMDINESLLPGDKKGKINWIFGKNYWKLTRNKYLLIFKLCKECQNRLFLNKKKFFTSSKRLHMVMSLCDDCVSVNIKADDLLAPPKKD
jgi:hypothetical protein